MPVAVNVIVLTAVCDDAVSAELWPELDAIENNPADVMNNAVFIISYRFMQLSICLISNSTYAVSDFNVGYDG